MGKLYIKNAEVTQHKLLKEEILSLVEQLLAKNEKQSIFRSLYDLEIMGVAIYYRKNWRYEGLTQDEQDEKETAFADVAD